MAMAEAVLRADLSSRYIDRTPDAVVVVSEDDGVIRWVNQSAERLFGYAFGQLVGQPIEVLLPVSLREKHEQHRQQYREELAPRPMGLGRDLRARHRTGREFPVSVQLDPFSSGDALYVMAVVRGT